MGVTEIASIQNGTNVPLFVMNYEHPGDTPDGGDAGQRIDPGDVMPYSMWIPWSGSNHDFPQHHIAILNQDGTEVYAVVWQAERNGDDAVRFSSDGVWHDPGNHVLGDPSVNGTRDVHVFGALGDLMVQMVPQPNPRIGQTNEVLLTPTPDGWGGDRQWPKKHQRIQGNVWLDGNDTGWFKSVSLSKDGGTDHPMTSGTQPWGTGAFSGQNPNGVWTISHYSLKDANTPGPLTLSFLALDY